WAIILIVVALVFSLKKYYATSNGKLVIDRLMLKAPVLGDVIRKSAVSRFTRTLGTLIASGVSILEGLEITAKTAGNRVIQDAIMESRASIAGGETISAPLKKSAVFPPMVISMIAVGEQTGGLDEMLTKIADFYDEEVDAAVSGLLALMEPMMIVFLGVVVGGMVVSMYLPIFDMVNAAGSAFEIDSRWLPSAGSSALFCCSLPPLHAVSAACSSPLLGTAGVLSDGVPQAVS